MNFIHYLFALALFLRQGSCDDPRVRIIGTDPPVHPIEGMVVQYKDKDVQFTCIVENKPQGQDVQWVVQPKGSDKNVQISTATRSYDAFRWSIDNPSSTAWRLRVSNAQVTDEGRYICKVQMTDKNYAEAATELKVVQKPQISDLETSSDMTKKAEGEAIFECFATGRPQPLVTWSRLAGELLPNGGTEFRGNTFKIDIVKADHAGVYKCSAANSAGKVERKVRLTVNFPPIVTSGESIVRQKVGYVKELVCNIKGYPQPEGGQITWTFQGGPIVSGGRFKVRNIPGAYNKITSILEINGVEAEDFDRYRCSARNSIGSAYKDIRLEESSVATITRNGMIRSAASVAISSVATLVMLLSVCLLHRLT